MTIVNTLWGLEEIEDTKVCSDCGEVKHILQFGCRGHKKDGTYERKNQCKSCLKIKSRDVRKHQKIFPKPTAVYRCPICKMNETEIKNKWKGFQGLSYSSKNIWRCDHIHSNGKFRAYICDYCNAMIGRSGDSAEILESGADYIRNHNV